MTLTQILTVDFFKRHYLWIALALSVFISWSVSQDELETSAVVEPNVRVQAAPMDSGTAKLPTAPDLGTQWPARAVSHHPVVDIFNSAIALSARAASAESKVQNTQPPKPSIEETFNFSYFGKIEQNGNETVFLEDDNSRVIAVRVGQPVSPQWQLVGSDAKTITFRHNSSGNLYQMKTRPEE